MKRNKLFVRRLLGLLLAFALLLASPGFLLATAQASSSEAVSAAETLAGDSECYVIYFDKPAAWSAASAYVWSDANGNLEAWPGVLMQFDSTLGKYWYPVPSWVDHVIFSDLGENQTADLTVSASANYVSGANISSLSQPTYTIYFNNTAGWEQVFAHVWNEGSNAAYTAWPGIKLARNSAGYYMANVPAAVNSAVFNNGLSGASEQKTGDLAISASQNSADASGNVSAYDPTQQPTSERKFFNGTILHCFDWKYTDIEAKLAASQAAGFDAIQTSPAQPAKGGDSNIWYWLYQPTAFYIGTNSLGTKDELASLCAAADKYGIDVIVDVVANHLAGGSWREDLHIGLNDEVPAEYFNTDYWHQFGDASDWNDRYHVTYGRIGMPDLNSEHPWVQGKIRSYVDELKSIGVDGIRWDAAKHIGLPSEGCGFWPAVCDPDLYHYGEILVGPADSGHEKEMAEYTQYISVTDSKYGDNVLEAFVEGKAPAFSGNWADRGVSSSRLVYWPESHDTFSNTEGATAPPCSQNTVDRAYAVVTARANAATLYFSRPNKYAKSSIIAGEMGSLHFASKEITAVNNFHRALLGEPDYYTASDNNCAVVNRTNGAVVVAGYGSNFATTVPNGGGLTKPGTYVDAITGNTWTVTETSMSGTIGETGIAVFYNEAATGKAKATVSRPSGAFSERSVNVTLGLLNAKSGTYTIDGGAKTSFENGQTVNLGSNLAVGESTILKLIADGGSVQKFVYTRVAPTSVNIKLPDGWSTPIYAYVYDDATGESNGTWPGVALTTASTSNIYGCDIPDSYTDPKVIFSTDTAANRYPAEGAAGLSISTPGKWLCEPDGKGGFLWHLWAEAPSILGTTLVLDGQLLMNFYTTIPDAFVNGSYMEFAVAGTPNQIVETSRATKDSAGRYIFACKVNVPQMADEVYATLHYGNNQSVTLSRSAEWYLNYIITNASNPAYSKYVTLAKALNNYGFYSLPALRAEAGHKAIAQLYSEPELPDPANLLTILETEKASLTKSGDVLEMNYSLNLESETVLNLYVTTNSDVTSATVDKDTVEISAPTKLQDGRWFVQIKGISATEIGDTYTIHLATSNGGTAQLIASVLSYVRSVLRAPLSDTLTQATKDSMAALYVYYDEAVRVRS